MPAPTENDRIVFASIKSQGKIALCLYKYLYEYSRQVDAGMDVFPSDDTQAQGNKISCVMRCYGFEDRNGQHIKQLNRKYGWGLDDETVWEDLQAFASRYPEGLPWLKGREVLLTVSGTSV